MRYKEFQAAIQHELLHRPEGLTWVQLRDHLDLPYERPCPAWTACLEREIGLVRIKGERRALVWKLGRPRRK